MVRVREYLEEQRKRGKARPDGDREAADKRRKAIQRQQSRQAVHYPKKKAETQGRFQIDG